MLTTWKTESVTDAAASSRQTALDRPTDILFLADTEGQASYLSLPPHLEDGRALTIVASEVGVAYSTDAESVQELTGQAIAG